MCLNSAANSTCGLADLTECVRRSGSHLLTPDSYTPASQAGKNTLEPTWLTRSSPDKTSCTARTTPSVIHKPPPEIMSWLDPLLCWRTARRQGTPVNLALNRGDRREGFSAAPLKKGGFERPVAQIGPAEGGDRRITLPRKVGQATEILERADEAGVIFFACHSDTKLDLECSRRTRYRLCCSATPTQCGSLRPRFSA